MDKRIIYSTKEGSVAVVVPTGVLSVEKTAAKDVPTGVPYWVVDVSEIPSDRKNRDAWELVDMPQPDGYGE